LCDLFWVDFKQKTMSESSLAKTSDLTPFSNITEAFLGTKCMDESLRLVGDLMFTHLTKENIEV
jgi:hypothetical protein